jgi:hypothetical protein
VRRAEPPFFLVGNPRSGTKMLRELLNRSPDVWISDIESHFIPPFTHRLAEFGDLDDRTNFERLAEALGKTRAFWYWTRRGVVVDVDAWYATCRRHDWPGVLEGLFHVVHDQEISDPPKPWDEILWGDKTPVYMTELTSLAQVFPAARFVHLVRDPRDCALSGAYTWGDSPLRTAQRWADRTRLCRDAGHRLGSERYFELRYEDLVTDVRGVLGQVFDFLGVPVPLDAGQFLRVPENLGEARGQAEVIDRNRHKWKARMDPAVRRRIEGIAGDLIEVFGYEREHPELPVRRLSRFELAVLKLRDAWRQVQFRRRELGWRGAIDFLRAR